MKIIIMAEDADLVREVVQKQGHAVMAETNDPAHLRDLILGHTPHIVFWEKAERTAREIENLSPVFARVRFVTLGFERGKTWTNTIRQTLRAGKCQKPWKLENPEKRQIVFDLRYYSLFPPATPWHSGESKNAEYETAIEAMRLSRMLRAATEIRNQARLHMEAMSFGCASEWQEIIHRTTKGSFEGPAFARQHLKRSLAYLAHFVPGVDLDGLLQPVDDPAYFRFVPYRATPEAHYALFALVLFGCNPDVARQLYRAMHWRHEGETSEQVTETGVAITGLAFTVHMLSLAHSTTIEWLLAPNTASRLSESRSRALHRSFQIFADWWGFRHIMDDEPRLRLVLDHFHDISEEPPLPENLRPPTFAQFLEAMKASQDETQTNQPNQT